MCNCTRPRHAQLFNAHHVTERQGCPHAYRLSSLFVGTILILKKHMYTGIQNEIQVLNNDLKYLFSETLFNGVPLLRYIPEIFGRLVVICESVSNLEISNEKEDNKRV